MFRRVIPAVLLALAAFAAPAQMVTLGASSSSPVRNGVLSDDWSEWETAMTGSCVEDETPGAFDGVMFGAQTRYKLVLQYPTASGEWPTEEGFTLPDDIEDGVLWDEPQTVEEPCDWDGGSPPGVPEDNTSAYLTTTRIELGGGGAPTYIPVSGGQFRIPCDWQPWRLASAPVLR
jgi:hypothetical protein